MASADLGQGLDSEWLAPTTEHLPGPRAPAVTLCRHAQAALCVSSSGSDEDKCDIISKFSSSLSSN